ncbi:MAG: F0F1 ATP synthase subunit alpha [Eubacteriales bacterium]|nr:F0F1 ATP synthase subunit alpha [Eubacteriales bacterium]
MELYSESLSGLKASVDKFDASQTGGMRRYGTVLESGDGIVTIDGLLDCKYGELLEFENGVNGIAFNMEEQAVGAVLLNGTSAIREGSRVLGTDRVVEVPVGLALLGRTVDPLGRPLDAKGTIHTDKFRPIEYEASRIIDRDAVNEPLQTGLMAIDSMVPIGKGQRELIIGDRQTGKSAIAVDTILNQKDKDVLCIYVAIGQKASSIARIINTLEKAGALEYTTIVAATASDSAPMQYIAPYAGCAMAEEFMYQGRDVLVVYDDLSKHAVAYRAMSLLLKRPPGREAYPGDVFYLHSRLLERAAKLSQAKGGGSMTALPIVETQSGDISSYIATNVISITDGQLFLESELFYAGIRPAVNVGFSVSRVGGSAQSKAMRKVAGQLRLDLSQYREMAVFAQFSSELDKATQTLLAQGERLTEMLKQPQYAPMAMEEQVVLLYVVTHRLLLNMPLQKIAAFKAGFIEYMHTHYADMMRGIARTGRLDDDDARCIEAAARDFLADFLPEEAKEAQA